LPAASSCPRSPERRGFQIRPVVVATRNSRRTNLDAANLSSIGQGAIGPAEPDLDTGMDAARRSVGFGVGKIVVAWPKRADDAHLAGAVSVHEDRAEALAGTAAECGWGRRPDVRERAQRGEIPSRHVGMVHQREELWLDEE
jgi:hypothetical protein